ncbi:MAG: hypothetical protein COY81_05385 [Candidatus Pacebacteria bacterium CG_4_10_14_0_8_um_filter_43_12]|nr:MAG: hypothetical protein COU66_00185 [Candidatus Pacebacteria bacterium CG10_big_fil_rev_8_21_14_0_10_44_11]PIY78911.1 MAG: hypothetical protein COY81_05385 [Candidatus Pacebacteria bacterium CG_4_10_14_0_8_um_filter_43_12]
MNLFQQLFVVSIFLVTIYILIISWRQAHDQKNSFGLAGWLYPFGIFVWGDALIIALFWLLISVASLLFNDWLLFLLLVSLFWVVRSWGEVNYWLLEQFSGIHRNKAKDLLGFLIVKNDSIFFIYQVFWQCCLVFSLLFAIYFAHLWLIRF